jgi:hypothetical protein
MSVLILNNALLTNAFQASQPFSIVGDNIVLDFTIVVANVAAPGTPAQVEWYPEYTSADPNAVGTGWFRETSEEDIGNGDVRMNLVVRRFATNGADAPLPDAATYRLDTQFSRKHNYCRIQIRVTAASADACRASILSVLGLAPLSAPP